jgi:tripartite-type tricarboxylate transporter receptor subunit TctC
MMNVAETMGRTSRWLAAALAGMLQCGAPAQSQDWPTRPVTMVIPFAAGGAPDLLGRILAPHLAEHLGKSVIIDNAGGAGGMTGSARVAKAAPDGYQFVLGTSGTHAVNQTLSKRPLYNAATDFAPVALIADQPVLLVARKDLPVDNLPEFIAYAKANQASMQYGSAGPGSGTHLACVRLNMAIGIDVAHVPYRGGTPAMQDLVAGRIDYQCATGSAIPQLESKTVKPIAILAQQRSPILPQLASAHEQGLTDFEAEVWFAIFLPKGTPQPIVQKLHAASLAAMNAAVVQAQIKSIAASVVAPGRRSPAYLQKFVESEIEKWAGPIRAAGVSMD